MSGDRLARFFLFSSYFWGFCFASINQAQIVPDNTLSDESSILVKENAIDRIESGAIRGETLFHSFEQFDVLSDRQVYFANPNGIEQIVTRVTGNNASNILGKLGVNGSANLFLLNPQGILFGQNASLDVGGSFVATTADGVVFDRDLVYSATNPEVPPLLNVNIPEGIQFGANAGAITVLGEGHTLGFNSETLMPIGDSSTSRLEVPAGNTLAFIAGELNLNGANLGASSGKIELAAIAQAGKIELESENNLFAFEYEKIDNFGKIDLFQQSLLDVRGGKNLGSVGLYGENITLYDGSAIIASKLNPGKSKTQGDINFVAADSLALVNNAADTFPSGVFTLIEQSSNHPGADIEIEAQELKLQNNALIVSTVTNKGQGGNISINARVNLIDNLDSSYNAGIYSQALAKAKGSVGIITVELNKLQLLDGQKIISIDDEDDLEDLIGENRAEDLEDFIEDKNTIIGTSESGVRSLVFQGGGEITSINRGDGKSGVAIISARTVEFSDASQSEVPEPEISEPEVPEPEVPAPEASKNPESDRVYIFELASGVKIAIDVEDLIQTAHSASVDRQTNDSRDSKRKLIEMYATRISTRETAKPDFDIPSGCSLGDSRFVIVGKGGIMENPFRNVMQTTTIADFETKPFSESTNISSAVDLPSDAADLIVEAQSWQINQSGKVELLASSQTNIPPSIILPNCSTKPL